MIALQLSRESYFILPISTCIELKLLQSWKGLPLIEVTLFGMNIDVKLVHPQKAFLPIDVTLLGMEIEAKLEQ